MRPTPSIVYLINVISVIAIYLDLPPLKKPLFLRVNLVVALGYSSRIPCISVSAILPWSVYSKPRLAKIKCGEATPDVLGEVVLGKVVR
jgi:hypothetical protein